MKITKAPGYDEVNQIPELRDEELPRHKATFQRVIGRPTTLSDDDIINIEAYADDGYDEDEFIDAMLLVENGRFPRTIIRDPDFGKEPSGPVPDLSHHFEDDADKGDEIG